MCIEGFDGGASRERAYEEIMDSKRVFQARRKYIGCIVTRGTHSRGRLETRKQRKSRYKRLPYSTLFPS